jgi:hypothetical protein
MKTDFFITYHHNDELAARWIAGVLKDVPFSILMESWDFLPGNQPLEKIEHMTAIAPCALVLFSERFLQRMCTVHDFMTFCLLSPRVISGVISCHKISGEEYPGAFDKHLPKRILHDSYHTDIYAMIKS